jgi:hypothetical protein
MTNTLSVIKAIQEIYPSIEGGFSYWETKKDGKNWDNPIDGLVWENTKFSKPTWDQIQAQLAIVDVEEAKQAKIAQCQNYLQSTDWQASAFIKYGRPVDTNVSNNFGKNVFYFDVFTPVDHRKVVFLAQV